MPTNSWPAVLHSASGNHPNMPFPIRSSSNTANPNSMNLNDPSIIFAQPAARPMGISNTPHDGQWHNHMTRSTLVGNGTLGASGIFLFLIILMCSYYSSNVLCNGHD